MPLCWFVALEKGERKEGSSLSTLLLSAFLFCAALYWRAGGRRAAYLGRTWGAHGGPQRESTGALTCSPSAAKTLMTAYYCAHMSSRPSRRLRRWLPSPGDLMSPHCCIVTDRRIVTGAADGRRRHREEYQRDAAAGETLKGGGIVAVYSAAYMRIRRDMPPRACHRAAGVEITPSVQNGRDICAWWLALGAYLLAGFLPTWRCAYNFLPDLPWRLLACGYVCSPSYVTHTVLAAVALPDCAVWFCCLTCTCRIAFGVFAAVLP